MRKFDWIFATIKLNWSNMLANKAAFWSLSVLMAVQNIIYFALWGIVFMRISELRGWGLKEIAFLYGSGALGYSFLFTVFGGINQVTDIIESGMLDVYLARPRSVILSLLLHRMRADSIGDTIAGIVLIAFIVKPELSDLPMILLLSLLAGIVYASFRLLMHTLTFWGTGGESNENGFIAFLIASTNPQNGFGAWGKFVLLTIFPAGYIALLPVEILKSFSWQLMAMQILGSLFVLAFSLFLFDRGLRRYASGNKFLSLR